jgi:putative ABC transport system permease protein
MTPRNAVASYRLLIRLLPRRWLALHGDALVSTFESLVNDAWRTSGRPGVFRALLREIRSLVSLAAMPSVRSYRRTKGPVFVISSLLQDVRYAARALRANPGFTLTALLTLALSIGVNSAAFSVVHGVLLRPLPHPEPDRLMLVGPRVDGDTAQVDAASPGTFYDWRAAQRSFESFSGYEDATVTLHGGKEPERIHGALSAGSVLETLGTPPLVGRLLTPEDDRLGRPYVAVVSERLASRLFRDAASALGQPLLLEHRAFTIVGVMPSGFRFPERDTEFWIPAQFPNELRYSRTEYMLVGVGRLRAGVTRETAEEELNAIMARIHSENPRINDGAIAVRDLKRAYIASVERPVLLMMAAVVLVLLMACANLASLLLARATTRAREIAVRQALGAGRGRLIRHILTESILLACAGGVLGLAASRWITYAVVAQLPAEMPRVDEIAIDWTVVAVTLGMSVGCGVLFGMTPALLLSRRGPAAALRDGGRASDAASWARTWFVAGELALAVVLLVSAGLLVRSFAALQNVDPGIRPERLLTFRLSLPSTAYPVPARPAALERALHLLERIAGVESAAAINQLPVTGRGIGAWLNIVGRPPLNGRNPDGVPYRVVTPDYFSVAGVKLVRGRLLQPADSLETGAVVIDETLARRYWPGEDPLGREIVLGAMPDYVLFPLGRIAGIVGDVKQVGLAADPPGMVYLPHRLAPYWSGFSIIVRTSGDPHAMVPAIRRALREFDPSLPVAQIQTMDEILARSLAPTRMPMVLLAGFAIAAVGLALLGVFGLIAYSVNRRRRELGIRVALGAEPRSVRRVVLRDGLRPAIAGIACGITAALVATRLLEGLLYGVAPADVVTFAGATVVLLACSALASYLPARRATRIDPAIVLKGE